jgi:uncharacterized protein YjbI with pentapeptide repeats
MVDLQKILRDHATWLSSNRASGSRANLRGAILEGANLWS